MTREGVKDYIVALVENGPIKGTEIASDYSIIKLLKEADLDVDICILLNELVDQKRIVEVEYVLPSMSYRIKSLYMPKGTEIVLKGGVCV